VEDDMSTHKGGRVPVGFFTADTPDEVIADAIIAAHEAAKKQAMEDDQRGPRDPEPNEGPRHPD
jgi:hypothetical protein